MALTTYGDLKEAAAKWLARTLDTQITANAADFVTLAEAWINRNLRVRQMETNMTFSTVDGGTNLPDDYLAWRSMQYLGDTYRVIQYRHPDVLSQRNPTGEAGIPTEFTIEGNDLIVRPVDDDATLDFLYYAKVPALELDDDNNWLLLAHPDLYLAATLSEANAFLINPEHATLWANKRDEIIRDITTLSEKTKGPSRMIPEGTWY